MADEQIDGRAVWESNLRLWFLLTLAGLGLPLVTGIVVAITSTSTHTRWIALGVMTMVLLVSIVVVAHITIRRARGASKDDLNAWFDWDLRADTPWVIGIVVVANAFFVLVAILALVFR